MGTKLNALALMALAGLIGCEKNPIAPQYAPLRGTVCVLVSGVDTSGNIVRIAGATVNITPRAMPAEVNPGVNLITDENGETEPWTYDKFAGLITKDGTVDPTKTADIHVKLDGWSDNALRYEFTQDTLRADPQVAQQP